MLKKIISSIKLAYFKLFSINDSPEKIALGFAVGSFLGIFPTFGLGGVLALFFSWILKLNYVSTILGAFIIMNPLTTPIFWFLSAIVGGIIFSKRSELILSAIKDKDIFHHLNDVAFTYLIGNTLVAVVTSLIGYLLIMKFILEYRRKSLKKYGK